MGGNKVAPPKKGAMAAGGTGKTYVGKPGGAANGSSGYGPAGGAPKRSGGMGGGMGGGGGASTAEVK